VRYENGDVYSGEMREGKREGTGQLFERATGMRYEGSWSEDVRHGYGTLTSKDQTFVYDGEWKNDMRTGNGRLIIEEEKYSGNFLNNKFHGQGVQVSAD
jgi:hypothetical protein